MNIPHACAEFGENKKGETLMFDLVPFHKDRDMARRGDAFDRFFDYMMEGPFAIQNRALSTFKVDVKDNGDSYELMAELPGIKKEDISVNYEDNYLTISVDHEEEHEDRRDSYLCKERHTGSMVRSFYINDVANDGIKAEFENGILKVALPKSDPKASRKKIDIN